MDYVQLWRMSKQTEKLNECAMAQEAGMTSQIRRGPVRNYLIIYWRKFIIYTYTLTDIHACKTYIHIHTHIYTYTYMHVHIHIPTNTPDLLFLLLNCMPIHHNDGWMFIMLLNDTPTQARTRARVHTRAYTHARTHTHYHGWLSSPVPQASLGNAASLGYYCAHAHRCT